MINTLNLATKPFRNRALPFLLAALLLFAAAVGLIVSLAYWKQTADTNKLLSEKNSLAQKLDKKFLIPVATHKKLT